LAALEHGNAAGFRQGGLDLQVAQRFGVARACTLDIGPGLFVLRLRERHTGFGLPDSHFEAGGIEPCERLIGADDGIVIGVEFGDLTGELRAHLDGIDRLERPGSSHVLHDVAARRGDVAQIILALLPRRYRSRKRIGQRKDENGRSEARDAFGKDVGLRVESHGSKLPPDLPLGQHTADGDCATTEVSNPDKRAGRARAFEFLRCSAWVPFRGRNENDRMRTVIQRYGTVGLAACAQALSYWETALGFVAGLPGFPAYFFVASGLNGEPTPVVVLASTPIEGKAGNV
jgi:hypothetical protein